VLYVALDIYESHLLIVSHGRRFIQKVALDFRRVRRQMTKQSLDQIVRPSEIIQKRKISRTTLWRQVRDGKFPKPVQLTSNTIGWFQSDLARHEAELRAAAGLPAHQESTE
jgi:prophage regulatory protein